MGFELETLWSRLSCSRLSCDEHYTLEHMKEHNALIFQQFKEYILLKKWQL